MMKADVVTLIAEEKGVDEYGDITVAEIERTVYCTVKSIKMNEFYQAMAVGLKPEITFVLTDEYDYHGELRCRYRDIKYSVLRTYKVGKGIELTCISEVNN